GAAFALALAMVAFAASGHAGPPLLVPGDGVIADLPGVADATSVFHRAAEQAVVARALRTGRVAIEAEALHAGRASVVAQQADTVLSRLAALRNRSHPAPVTGLPADL